MTLASRLTARLAKMPPPKTRDVSVDRSVSIPMPDGVTLLADRYYPTAQPSGLPLLITRTPYGRQIEGALARILAERGYQVLLVSCRSTFGSGGVWVPFRNERADGQAVLAWTAEQPWFGGKVGLYGASYVGLTQWSVIDGLPDYATAWAPTVTSSYFADLFYPGDGFALETVLTWIESVAHQEEPIVKRLLGAAKAKKAVAAASLVLPLSDADVAVTGAQQPQYQDWLEHADRNDPWWAPVKFDTDISKTPPGSFTGGWYDIFLPNQLRDYVALRAIGREARIAIGPWTHGSLGQAGQAMRSTLDWMDRYVGGHQPALTAGEPRVKLLVMGADKWVDFPDWPPPATSQRWNLQAGGGLSTAAPTQSEPDRFRFDPSDPTPGIGGGSLLAQNAGRKENKSRESRKDVLLYTSDAMADDLTVAGPLSAELHVKSSLDHTDFYVRLCDVDPKGRSFNLADGIVRIGPDHPRNSEGGLDLRIELFPTANTFLKGHRIRLQVSSGAHPLYVRNLGTGDLLGKGTEMVAADQQVFHDPARPSAIVLPVLDAPVRA